MAEETYKKALQDAMRETEELLASRNEIEKRLAQLKTTVLALSALLQEPPQGDETKAEISDVGISEAIRKILIGPSPLSPAQVKTKLTDAGFDLSKYSNPSAVIHNTIKRLESQGEVLQVRTAFKDVAYTLAPEIGASLSASGLTGLEALIQQAHRASPTLEAFKNAYDSRKLIEEQFAKIFPKSEGGSK